MKIIPDILPWVTTLFYAAVTTIAWAILVLVFFIFYGAQGLPQLPHPLARIIETPKTEIFAASGEKLITLGRKEPVPLSRVSPHFINAILAVEDHKFMDHSGFSKLRTLKAIYVTLVQPGRIQGASTITQQLAKNLFFSFKQTYLRKFKELLVALQIEYTFPKTEILHAYVNQIAFGAGAQGVERAARVFFGKPAADLTLGEATLLAGLPQSPSRYNPYRHYDRALKRREVVIHRMVATGYLTREKAADILKEKPVLAALHADARTGSYFLDTLIGQLILQYGSDVVFHGGIKVTVTLDTTMQRAAEMAVTRGMNHLDSLMGADTKNTPVPQVALVAIDTGSGAVKALVGGRNYYRSEFNRTVSSQRRAGSAFNPFALYAAMKQDNLHGGTIMPSPNRDIPSGNSVSGEYPDKIILKQALTLSENKIFADLMESTDPAMVTDIAHLCGITTPMEFTPSMEPGSWKITPLEMAAACATFASGGIRHLPFYIWRVEDPLGHVIYEHLVQGEKVLDDATVFQVVDMMQTVVDKGAAREIRKQGFSRPAAGGTGTSSGFQDAWFAGFTPDLSTSVWTGYDTPEKLKTIDNRGITGAMAAVPIWTTFMKEALRVEPVRQFTIPDGVSFKAVDPTTGCAPRTTQIPPVIIPLKPGQIICGDETF